MIKGDPEGHFFEDNREFRYIPECKELIREYGELQAGKYMWAIWMVHHPGSSIFDMSVEDKIEWVKSEYLEDVDFDWPMREFVPEPEPPKRGRKKKDEDEFEMDLMFENTCVHQAFFNVVQVFGLISMSIEERNYYDLVTLNDECIREARSLNAKDKAAALTNIARASAEIDKVKAKYLSWRESVTQTGGQVQSGGASRRKK